MSLAAMNIDVTRRSVLRMAGLAAAGGLLAAEVKATKFQIGCMTLPYSDVPLERALQGIAGAGYRYVAWGTTHPDSAGRKVQIVDAAAPPKAAAELAARCRGLGLEPVMMFSQIYVAAPDSVKVHTQRIRQAAAARMPFVLTFGHIEKGGLEEWVRNLRELGPIARSEKVTIVIKQHGGNTATGKDCAAIVEAVGDEGVKMFYDAGNVLDYNNDDPLPDIKTCWQHVRGFCIKDHRNTPKDEDCGIGFGEIDHYKLLMPLLQTGLTIPLVCENIFEPLLPRPKDAAGIDALARRSREYLETLTGGLTKGI
jgi:sugar phosphate isomerase/epimerase